MFLPSIKLNNTVVPHLCNLHLRTFHLGAIHKRRRQFRGGEGGVKLTIWGDMRGVGVKENPISSMQDFFFYFSFIWEQN